VARTETEMPVRQATCLEQSVFSTRVHWPMFIYEYHRLSFRR
jgi:hypothetical protein